MNRRNKYLLDLGGLTSDPLRVLYLCSTCSDLSFPTLTQEFWVPGKTHGSQQESKNDLLWFPTCLPVGRMCEICCSGMCRTLADRKLPRDIYLQGKRWQIHDRLSCSRCTGGINIEVLIIASHAQVWHYTLLQLFRVERNSSQMYNLPGMSLSEAKGSIFMGRTRSGSAMTQWCDPDLEISFAHVFGVFNARVAQR